MNIDKMNKYLQMSAQDKHWDESVRLREAVIREKYDMDKTDIQVAKSRKTAQEIIENYLEKNNGSNSTAVREQTEFFQISAQSAKESIVKESPKSENLKESTISQESIKPQESTQTKNSASEQQKLQEKTEKEKLIEETAKRNALAQNSAEAMQAVMERLNQKIIIPTQTGSSKKKGILRRKNNKNAETTEQNSGVQIYYTIMNRTPVIDYGEKGRANQEKVMSYIDKRSDDPIEMMEQIFEANDKVMHEEYEEYVANGGDPDKYVPELIPYGLVYETYIASKRKEEERRRKEERSLKNKLKKKFNNDKKNNAEAQKSQYSKVSASQNQDSQNDTAQSKISATQPHNKNSANNDGGQSNKDIDNNARVRNGAFKDNFQVDANVASSANRIYERKNEEWDKQRQSYEQILIQNYELRELGIQFDETLSKELSYNVAFKIFSAMFIASALTFNDPQWTPALVTCGIIAYAGAKLAEIKGDLKYRKAVDAVRQAYIDSHGDMTKEDVKRILNLCDKKLPDAYALACMTQEERNAILEEAKNPNELSKRKLIKHIKNELLDYQVMQYEKMKKQKKAREQELKTK